MNLTSRQLEELEHAHDSTGSLDNSEEADKEEVSEAALEWRMQLIEEAAGAIKRAKTRPVDPEMTYEPQSLLFDSETRRFGRVAASVPGFLKIRYLSGGEREWGLLDVDTYLISTGSTRLSAELAVNLGLDEDEVLTHMDRLGIEPMAPPPDPKEIEKAEKAEKAEQAAAQKNGAKAQAGAKNGATNNGAAKGSSSAGKAGNGVTADPSATSNTKKAGADEKKTKADAKASLKSKPAPDAKKPAAKKSPGKAAAVKKAKDAVDRFIQKNFKKLTNRELAGETGLSEHTIRRKLGEWGLKRK